ncbi:hypothetical protein LTR09_006463 [Extremus antarcticus]|uniref:DUF7728 domain-containing protein n=1 Tax=Extremus antarcticus TaxID=702011 RepID=A0AAJ0GDF2_9PEZI|nr:hypothetical protein LTR09_006463 [Extremus antarcticus]
MLFSSTVLAAICVGATSAIVLPPGLHLPSADEEQARPTSIANPKRQRIEIPCPSCAFPTSQHTDTDDDFAKDDEAAFWTQSSNILTLDFSISKDGQKLQLDDEAIYPSQAYIAAAFGGLPIYVTQTPAQAADLDSFSTEPYRTPLEVTAFGLVVSSSPSISDFGEDDQNGDRVIRTQLQITGLNRQYVDLGGIAIDLLRTNDGELAILSILWLAPSSTPLSPPLSEMPPPTLSQPQAGTSCATSPGMTCKLKSLLTTLRKNGLGLRTRPSCSGRRKAGSNFSPMGQQHHSRPQHWRPSDSYRYGHRRPHILPSLTRSVIAILIPVMAGITTGLLVSLVGLLMGRVIGYAWIKVARLRRNRDGGIRSDDESWPGEGRDGREKHVHLEPPPVYEHAPAYEDAPAYEEVSFTIRVR